MKKYSMFIVLAVATLATTSCDKDNNDNRDNESADIAISTSISPLSPTTTGEDGVRNFSANDAISVYVWTGKADAVNADAMVVNNSINTYDGTSKWMAKPQMQWKDLDNAHYFLAVHPSKAITDFTADSYTLNVADQAASDLLVAVNKGTDDAGLKATDTAVPLQFDHLLAKLVVNLTFRSEWDETPTVESVTLDNLKSKATVDYLAKRVSATADEATSIVLPATAANVTYQSVMVPQAGEATTIIVRIGSKDYPYTDAVKLEGGKYTTVKLILGRDKITFGSVSINNWGTGDAGSGGIAIE